MTGSAKPPTQAQRLLELLRERGERGVTPLDALERIGSFRLAARVHDLRHPREGVGYVIEDVGYTTDSGARVARYVLVGAQAAPCPLIARGQVELPW